MKNDDRRVTRCRAGLAAPALLLSLAAPALAQEERSSAPSLPDSGGEDAPPRRRTTGWTCSRSGSRSSAIGCANRRRRGRRASRRCRGTATSTSASSFRSGNGGVGWVRDAGHCAVPAVRQLRVGVPRRHPRRPPINTRGEVGGPRRRARIDGAPLRRHQLGRRRQLHPQRDQPSPPLPAVRQRDHAREHQLRPAHRIGLHARRHRRRRPGRARVPAHEGRQDVGVRGQDPAGVRHRVQRARSPTSASASRRR